MTSKLYVVGLSACLLLGSIGCSQEDVVVRTAAGEQASVARFATFSVILPSAEQSMERQASRDLEAGMFDSLAPAITSPSWGIARVALLACEFRKEDESGIPVSPRAIDGALAILARTQGQTHPDAVLARIRALRVRDNAFIQIDPPPPLGLRYTPEEFDRAYADRDRRPHRPSAIMSFAR